MNDWQKVENPVEGGVSAPDSGDVPASPPFPSSSPIPPHRPRKRRSDAGKKRSPASEPTPPTPPISPSPSPAYETAGPAPAPAPVSTEAVGAVVKGHAGDADGLSPTPTPKNDGWSAVSAPRHKAIPRAAVSAETAAEAASVKSAETSGGTADASGTADALGTAGEREEAGWLSEPAPVLSPVRYTSTGRRRGMHRWAAPLGFLILLLAIVGLGALAELGIKAIQRSQDDTALRAELDDFLQPIMQYDPSAFEDVNATRQDALLLSAIWRLTDAERIRQLRENTDVCSYPMDDNSRMLIPLEEINASYAYLFGPDAVPYHHTIGEEGMSFTFEYDPEQSCYHVPNTSSSSMYIPVLDKLKKKGDTVTVRVGYVLTTKIGIDEKGEQIEPTAADADHFQLYTVQRVGEDGWKLVSITDEKGSSAAATTVPAESSGNAALSSGTGITSGGTESTAGSAPAGESAAA